VRLDEFTYVPPEILEKALRYLAHLSGDPGAGHEALVESLNKSLDGAWTQNQFIYVREDQAVDSLDEADALVFRTDLSTSKGEEIWAKCMVNKKPGARQKWFGLFFQAVRREGFFINDLYFRTWNEGLDFLDQLAALAIPEKWSYSRFASKQNHPILKSYLEKTLERITQQDKLVRASGQVLFNTGLINTWFKEIYIMCDVDAENPNQLCNARLVLETDRVVLETFRNKKPAMATFLQKVTDVVFDPDLEVNTDDAHIIEDNFERIPAEYQAMRRSQVFALFQAAIDFARVMARRNYKMIVPQFYNSQIQFLMPIYLSGEFTGPPDFALVLEKINNCYRGNTILTLDMAYQNARLIAKPDSTWLNPEADPMPAGATR
jgi:hypothetical protein